MFKEHVKTKKANDVEAEILTKSGKVKPVRITASVILVGGKPIIQGIFRDITERKKVEEMVRANEKRFRTLFENSPVSLWEGEISDIMDYFESLRAKGVKDFGKHFKEHPEDVSHCATMVKIVDVNKATLKLFKAKNRMEVMLCLY